MHGLLSLPPMPQSRYLRIFSFLWRMKRVEHALAATWQARHLAPAPQPNERKEEETRHASAHACPRCPDTERVRAPLPPQIMKPSTAMAISRGEAAGNPGGQILLAQLRRCHMLRNEMHHFSTNLHHYVMFEARACGPSRALPPPLRR